MADICRKCATAPDANSVWCDIIFDSHSLDRCKDDR